LYPQQITGGCFGGRRSVGKFGGRGEDAVRRDDVDLLQVWNWKAAAMKRKVGG
jgi:hypothetical protein